MPVADISKFLVDVAGFVICCMERPRIREMEPAKKAVDLFDW